MFKVQDDDVDLFEGEHCFGTMDDALRATIQTVMEQGAKISPRGRETIELLGYGFRLVSPRNRRISIRARRWSEALAIGELCWHLRASDDVEFISYYSKNWATFSEDGRHVLGSCYGKRIFSKAGDGLSQWDRLGALLKHDRYTRRAVLTFADDLSPNVYGVDYPCLTNIQFLIRDGKLNCVASMRSNDAIWGLCYDVFFVTMLQEILSAQLGLELGWYQHVANSIHIYAEFYELASVILREMRSVASPMRSLSGVESLGEFLQAEEHLRRGTNAALDTVSRLAPYWRELAEPLVQKYRLRKRATDVEKNAFS